MNKENLIMKKVLLSLLLLFLLLASVACGQRQTQSPTPTATPSVSPTPVATATDAITPSPSTEPSPVTDPSVGVKPTPTTTPKSIIEPTAKPTPTYVLNPTVWDEDTVFSSKEEFHWCVQESKRQVAKGEEKRRDALDDVERYIDFRTIKKELAVDKIEMSTGHIAIFYSDSQDKNKKNLLVQLYRIFDPNYVEDFKNRIPNPIEIIKINGNPAIKDIVYQGDEYIGNYYNWTESGMNIFLIVPAWLLEKYPEEDFFDIQIVTVPKG